MKKLRYILLFLLLLFVPALEAAVIHRIGVGQGELATTAFTKINSNFVSVSNAISLLEGDVAARAYTSEFQDGTNALSTNLTALLNSKMPLSNGTGTNTTFVNAAGVSNTVPLSVSPTATLTNDTLRIIGYDVEGGVFADVFRVRGLNIFGGSSQIDPDVTYSFVGLANESGLVEATATSFIGAGAGNWITNALTSSIVGGLNNTIAATVQSAYIGGGYLNKIKLGAYGAIPGGAANTVSNEYSFIAGGGANVAMGKYSGVLGGFENVASGNYSLAAGANAQAVHQGTFVWADWWDTTFTSTTSNQFLIRASGGVGIGTNSPQAALHVNGPVIFNDIGSNASPVSFAAFDADGRLYETAVPFGSGGITAAQGTNIANAAIAASNANWVARINGVATGLNSTNTTLSLSTTLRPARFELGGVGAEIGMVVVGDSNAKGTPQSAAYSRYEAHSFPNWIATLGGSRIKMLANRGVAGSTSADALTTLSVGALSHQADIAPVQIGINDRNSAIAASVTESNIFEIARQLQMDGIAPIICSIPPNPNDDEGVQRVNTALRVAAQYFGGYYVDTYSLLTDPATKRLRVEYQHDPAPGGEIHLNQRAASAVARLILETIGIPPKLYAHNANLAISDSDTNNLVLNGLGAGTGTPDDWTLFGPGAVSLLADTNIHGNWIVLSNTTVSGTTMLSNNAILSVTAGDKLSFCFRLQVSVLAAAATNSGINVGVEYLGSSTPDTEFAPLWALTNDVPAGSVVNFNAVAPTGTTGLVVNVRMTNVIGEVRFAQMKLANLTRDVYAPGVYDTGLTRGGLGIKMRVGGAAGGNIAIQSASAPSISPLAGYGLNVPRMNSSTQSLNAGTSEWSTEGGAGARVRLRNGSSTPIPFALLTAGFTNLAAETDFSTWLASYRFSFSSNGVFSFFNPATAKHWAHAPTNVTQNITNFYDSPWPTVLGGCWQVASSNAVGSGFEVRWTNGPCGGSGAGSATSNYVALAVGDQTLTNVPSWGHTNIVVTNGVFDFNGRAWQNWTLTNNGWLGVTNIPAANSLPKTIRGMVWNPMNFQILVVTSSVVRIDPPGGSLVFSSNGPTYLYIHFDGTTNVWLSTDDGLFSGTGEHVALTNSPQFVTPMINGQTITGGILTDANAFQATNTILTFLQSMATNQLFFRRQTNYAQATSIAINASTDVAATQTNPFTANASLLLTSAVVGTSGRFSGPSDGTPRTLKVYSAHPIVMLSTNETTEGTNIVTTASKWVTVHWSVEQSNNIPVLAVWAKSQP